jgi:hypothetical protein
LKFVLIFILARRRVSLGERRGAHEEMERHFDK